MPRNQSGGISNTPAMWKDGYQCTDLMNSFYFHSIVTLVSMKTFDYLNPKQVPLCNASFYFAKMRGGHITP